MVLLLSDFMKLAICSTLLKLLPDPESAPVTAGSPNVYVAVPAILVGRSMPRVALAWLLTAPTQYTWQTQLLIYAAKDLDVIAYQVRPDYRVSVQKLMHGDGDLPAGHQPVKDLDNCRFQRLAAPT
jgi:hypothetical protein